MHAQKLALTALTMSDFQIRPTRSLVEPVGVSGWLLFFALTMVLFVPAGHVVMFLRSYRHTTELLARTSHAYTHYMFYAVEQIALAVLYIYGIFAGIQLCKTRPNALTHAKRFLLLVVVFHLADFGAMLNIVWILDPRGTMIRYLPNAFFRQVRNLVYPVIWYAYLLNSTRVRNTFPSETKPPTRHETIAI